MFCTKIAHWFYAKSQQFQPVDRGLAIWYTLIQKVVVWLDSKRISIKNICLCGLMAALIAVCSWISIPLGEVPITLQNFAVFLTLGLLGGRLGTTVIVVYILLGAMGLPVFSGFRGGIGILFSTTGGYILGFLLSAVVYQIFERICGKKPFIMVFSMIAGLCICYAFGTFWFMILHTKNTGALGIKAGLSLCGLPFIIPDILKILCAVFIIKRVKMHISIDIQTWIFIINLNFEKNTWLYIKIRVYYPCKRE